ncbi:MAG: GGDEF domain-containing protein [Lachnospiraceae bacterium]|nr:GGDEF domain-containing protein [Lachnospiraceae bacterium]
MSDKKRYTIGVFVSGITDNFTVNLCRGINREAQELDMNVVVLPGKYLFRDFSKCPEYRYEYQYGTVFSHIHKDNIDGLIIAAGCIGCMTTEEKLMHFLEQYREIPNVFVASTFDGYTCISYDNKNAVTEGMEYMITKAGCKHICILDGPEGNTDEQERKAAYLAALRKHNLPFKSTMRATGDLGDSVASRQAAKALILDNPRMDGLFCVNDAMAYAAYEVMQEMGIRPGTDVKIMGYDNEQRSLTMNPPLATVAADPVMLGRQATEAIYKKLNGEVIENFTLPSRFVLRESLGEKEQEPVHFTVGEKETLWEDFEHIFYRYVNIHGKEKSTELYQLFSEAMEEVMNSIEGHLLLSLSKQTILKRIDALFKADAMSYMDLDEMMYYIELQSKRALEKRKADPEDEAQLRELLTEIYRRLVIAVDKRYNVVEHEQDIRKMEMRDFVRSTMNFNCSSESSYLSMLNCLDWLDVKNACLYLYHETIIHKDGDVFPVQKEYLCRAYCENGVAGLVPEEYQKIPYTKIFSSEALGDKRWSAVLLPLYFGEENYGVIFCDLSERMYEDGEFAAGQLGAAAHMLHILNINATIQKQLESHLEVTQKENTQLDQLSKSDELTGLLNRRGFTDQAEELLKKCKSERSSCMIVFIDMNNLKIVNDRFGHDDGDYALQAVARLLLDVMPGGAVISRIGGDEFACAVKSDIVLEAKFQGRLKEAFDEFNKYSDKPYLVSVSAGTCVVRPQDTKTLEQALNQADEKLYLAKQNKDPRILKAEL